MVCNPVYMLQYFLFYNDSEGKGISIRFRVETQKGSFNPESKIQRAPSTEYTRYPYY